MQGFIPGDWNWLISCLNYPETKERGLEGVKIQKMLLKGEHAPYFPLSIYPSSAPASCISMHIVHVPLVVLVLILFCLFDLVCRCNPHRKLDEILLRRLGIILFNSGVRDQTKLSGEKKGFQIHVAIFFLFF